MVATVSSSRGIGATMNDQLKVRERAVAVPGLPALPESGPGR